MGLVDYLSVFRRRWPVIAAAVVVAITAAWFTTATFAPVAVSAPTYQASTLLFPTGATLNLNALAVIATIEPVTKRAARILEFEGKDPLTLRERVQASPDPETGFLTVTGFAATREKAEARTDAFAKALIDYLLDQQRGGSGTQIASLEEKIRKARSSGDLALAEELQQQLSFLVAAASSPIAIDVIERGNAREVESTGFEPPDSRAIRLAIAAAIGLLAGAGLALILERVDTKIRTSEQATERFGYPVLAEIPTIPRDQRRGVVTADHPTSSGSDAFRLLGAGAHVAVRPQQEKEAASGLIVLVTSSGPAEGKSTIVANLAAVLAEEGKRVIVFSADLRRPTLHDVLGSTSKPGLVQASHHQSPGLREYKQWTRFDHVYFVPSGGPAERPGEVLASPAVADLLEQARGSADWVLLDTAPILVAGESAPLIDLADLVLVVARAGTTSLRVAERTRDTLHRLGADAAWVVLNGSREGGVPTGYRRYHIAAERNARPNEPGMVGR